ncbi:hypothetical protein SGLAM104S_06497 [Streptomyces glaucescens]
MTTSTAPKIAANVTERTWRPGARGAALRARPCSARRCGAARWRAARSAKKDADRHPRAAARPRRPGVDRPMEMIGPKWTDPVHHGLERVRGVQLRGAPVGRPPQRARIIAPTLGTPIRRRPRTAPRPVRTRSARRTAAARRPAETSVADAPAAASVPTGPATGNRGPATAADSAIVTRERAREPVAPGELGDHRSDADAHHRQRHPAEETGGENALEPGAANRRDTGWARGSPAARSGGRVDADMLRHAATWAARTRP